MATCQAVIKRSLRMLGVLPAGREPSAADAADALEALIGLYQDLIAQGALGALRPVIVNADYTACENVRISNPTAAPVIITLPETITSRTDDCCDIWGYDTERARAPRDRAVVFIAGDTPQSYIYEAATATWVQLELLQLTDQAPLSATLAEGLSGRLAVTIAPEFSSTPPTQAVALLAARFMSAITGRQSETRAPVQTAYF